MEANDQNQEGEVSVLNEEEIKQKCENNEPGQHTTVLNKKCIRYR